MFLQKAIVSVETTNSAIVTKAAIDNMQRKGHTAVFRHKVLFIKRGFGLLCLQAIVC